MNIDRPYRVREIAEKLGLSRTAVRQAIRDGRIPGFRVTKTLILIPRAAFDEFIAEKMAGTK